MRPPFSLHIALQYTFLKLFRFNIEKRHRRGSGWVPVGFTDFKSAGVHPSVCAEGSTPLHSRQ